MFTMYLPLASMCLQYTHVEKRLLRGQRTTSHLRQYYRYCVNRLREIHTWVPPISYDHLFSPSQPQGQGVTSIFFFSSPSLLGSHRGISNPLPPCKPPGTADHDEA
jgi:hypothetical protein